MTHRSNWLHAPTPQHIQGKHFRAVDLDSLERTNLSGQASEMTYDTMKTHLQCGHCQSVCRMEDTRCVVCGRNPSIESREPTDLTTRRSTRVAGNRRDRRSKSRCYLGEAQAPVVDFSNRERSLLARYGRFYFELARGRRKPTTKGQMQFVAVCRSRRRPATVHELAYSKYLYYCQAGILVCLPWKIACWKVASWRWEE